MYDNIETLINDLMEENCFAEVVVRQDDSGFVARIADESGSSLLDRTGEVFLVSPECPSINEALEYLDGLCFE